MKRETAFEQGNRLLAAGDYPQAIAAFDRCLAQDARDWQACFNRGTAWMRQKQYAQALQDYLRAAELNPASTNIKCNLAVLLKELGEFKLAETLLLEALGQDARQQEAWSNLGVVLQHQQRYADAIECHRNALQLGGERPGLLNNLGNALANALRLEEALDAYQRGLAQAPDDAGLAFNCSITLLLLGRYREAWPLYEERWRSFLTPRFRERPWRGEALDGKTLLLWAEQGLGDSLQMARFLPELRRRYPRARLRLAAPAAFTRLFRQLDGVELRELDDNLALEDCDWQLPLMSLPLRLDLELAQLDGAPYLCVDPVWLGDSHRLPPVAGKRLRVGIVWQSGVWGVGAQDAQRRSKSIPLPQFLPLLETADVDWVSLQPEPPPAEMAGRVAHYPLRDFADTAAVVSQLDLVISVDTAVVHLAGALGAPVWVLMRYESAPFFMAAGERAPWYASARVWRQPAPGAWSDVIAEVCRALPAFGAKVLA
ncbi:hypothetical protein CEK28_14945 [Xenophilus sp. AP218F]|nr:hypothetical protein CEK28_14945 [Xenophilus sp. AP218F]